MNHEYKPMFKNRFINISFHFWSHVALCEFSKKNMVDQAFEKMRPWSKKPQIKTVFRPAVDRMVGPWKKRPTANTNKFQKSF